MPAGDWALSRGIGGHHRGHRGRTDEWLTPPELIAALGPFDLDPCAPIDRPWPTATNHYTVLDDGLDQVWRGRVWLNPPYGPDLGRWLAKMARHGNGVALVFARTETEAFHRWVWPKAIAVLFIRGRLNFHNVAGERARKNAGGPTMLIAYGINNAHWLERAKERIAGACVWLRR